MANHGRSDKTFWGGYNHYDEKGRRIGQSRPSGLEGFTDYDAKGRKIGRSRPNIWGGLNHYDNRGHKIGATNPGILSDFDHYDERGRKTGSSWKTVRGYRHEDSCYIATCVYGSYDCPEVWTLRRFRDGTLKKTPAGRLFIRVYYAVSPSLVRLFGEKQGFRRFFRAPLDGLVRRLREAGVKDTPYTDKK